MVEYIYIYIYIYYIYIYIYIYIYLFVLDRECGFESFVPRAALPNFDSAMKL
jgi:hypothetical protein